MDRRRFNGPDISISLSEFPLCSKNLKSLRKDEEADAVEEEIRANGRASDASRPIFFKAGLINQANGSSYAEIGNTKVIVAVYGPRALPSKEGFSDQAKIYCEFKFASFSTPKRSSAQMDDSEREISTWIVESLSPCIRLFLYPKTTIDIYVTVLENDGLGSSIALAISSASIAIADAGIEMFDLVSCSSLSLMKNSHLYIDAELNEEKRQIGWALLACMYSRDRVTHFLQNGSVNLQTFYEITERLKDNCGSIHGLLVKCLKDTIQRKIKKTKRKRTASSIDNA